MRSVQGPLSVVVVLASTLPAWLAADGVQLPDAMLPQSSSAAQPGNWMARGEEAALNQATSTQRRTPRNVEVELAGTDRSGRTTEASVTRSKAATAQSETAVAQTPTAAERIQAQAVITDQSRAAPNQVRQGNKNDRRPHRASSLASALFPEYVSPTNPYGDINDMRGLRPYKPGVRYDRETEDDRDSSVFGLLFGR